MCTMETEGFFFSDSAEDKQTQLGADCEFTGAF